MENDSNLEYMARIYNLDYENKTCVDCKKAYPKFVSINNGTVVCTACAEAHRLLGVNISYIRCLNDQWDEYLLLFMLRGGNSRFIRMIREYDIPEDSDIGYKYRTKAAENYRKIIRSEVLADEPPERLQKIVGKEISHCKYILNPEFENYSFLIAEQMQEEDALKQKKGVFKFMGRIFSHVGFSVGNAAIYLKDRVQEIELREKLKTSSAAAYDVMKTAGGYMALKGEPVFGKLKEKTIEGFEIVSNKTSQGACYVKSKAVEYYYDFKHKMTTTTTTTTTSQSNSNSAKEISLFSPNHNDSETIEVDLGMTEYINEKAIPERECCIDTELIVKQNNSFTLFGSNNEYEIRQENITVQPCIELPTYEEIVRQKGVPGSVVDINKMNS